MNKRFEELDILRGLSVIGMILVIVPGAWDQRFTWLNHADWRGFSFADMIFPTFLFCVGFSIVLSINNRIANKQNVFKHILVRSILLISLGLIMSLIPDFDFKNFRIPGILQRIGFCYLLVGSLITYSFPMNTEGNAIIKKQIKVLLICIGLISAFYWIILNFIPVPKLNMTGYDSEKSWPAFIDRSIFGVNHLWVYGQTKGVVTYDPEGLLSTIPSCINVIAGAIMGLLYRGKNKLFNLKYLFTIGFILILLGWSFDKTGIDLMIKKIWTISFAILSSGFSIVLFAFIILTGRTVISKIYFPAKVFGANTLLGFIIGILSGLLIDRPIIKINNEYKSLRDSGFAFFKQIFDNPQYASFAFSITFLIISFLFLYILYRRKWYIKL